MTSRWRDIAKAIALRSPFALLAQRASERRVAAEAEPVPETDDNGVPIPPALLMATVAGHAEWRGFLRSGNEALETFAAAVDRNGGDFRAASRVLDFGCGCGRLARHAPAHTSAEIHGVDYNADLVAWCAESLPGTYTKNKLRPPLDFPDDHFDVVYLLSVFTHLRIATQIDWLKELNRVIAPGGFCLVTFHDEDHVNLPRTGISRDALLKDGFGYNNNAAEGSNLISTFQTRAQMIKLAEPWFDVCEIITSTDNPITQAIAVLRRPS